MTETMSKATLLICRSCHGAEQRLPEQAADGAALCERIQNLYHTRMGQHELEIRGVNCLWTCAHPCSMALMADGKPSYLLAKVIIQDGTLDDVADAALQLSAFFLDSKSGNIPWQQFPDLLTTDSVARIPTSDWNSADDDS
ncbi:DUF1636 family protein [Cyanobium sp. CH-040]|uniref:DUF1636 family protein n=1 Tax=Cyanobium sp. CH-040 TaxID=2823708 RepID=UPI0020CD54A2|nr:DUF1636 family protein [Cyanobium sp. CH-040]MCP9928795.1 DUF1636 family protein [Cyanobium sp. CH-040]